MTWLHLIESLDRELSVVTGGRVAGIALDYGVGLAIMLKSFEVIESPELC
ncbi:MAG: hypothetical protein QXM43_01755 [Desulfurococcaceae archaeon]